MPASSQPPITDLPPSGEAYLTLVLYVGIAVFLIGLLMLLAWGLGQRTSSVTKQEPYESGIFPTGQAKLSTPVPFYLVAIFFIVFDIEMIFVVSWAIAYDRLGWAGFAQVTFFILILFVGLIHLWKTGGLDWGPHPDRKRNQSAGKGSG